MFSDTTKKQISRQWQRFFAGEDVDAATLRDFILESWHRSKKHGVDPDKVEPRKLTGPTLQAIIDARKELIRISMPVIENLYVFIAVSHSVIMLTDENGIILKSTGDSDYFTKSGAYDPGLEYLEKTVGTNGIGTSLAINAPVQIWAEEHYARINHAVSCSASPIHDPQGKVIGCLNLTCLWDQVHTHTLGMIKAAASAIEQQLRIEAVLENKVALLQEKQGLFELINDGLMTLDRNLRITDINEHARRMLSIEGENGEGSHIKEFVLSGVDFARIIHLGKPIHDREATLQLGGGVLNCVMSSTPITTSGGLVITLREAKSVRRMVNRYAGSKAVFTFDDIVGVSPRLMESVRLARIAGKSRTNTLLLGESGTGKEMFAQAIHNVSDRCRGPFIAVNCGALPRELIQSELFGYAEGAFTGARRQGNPGKFELADGGTIFLDEIGEMPLSAQVNLLRVVEEKEVVRVGDKYGRPVDVRIIAATNRQLSQAIAEKTFREDLYYRLNVLTINLPPLRLRGRDVENLVEHFLDKVCRANSAEKPRLEEGVLAALCAYRWPGNIRELENTIERAVHVCQGNLITMTDLSRDIVHPGQNGFSVSEQQHEVASAALLRPVSSHSLKETEYTSILHALDENGGNIRRSAEMLGIARSTLYEKIRKFRIDVAAMR